jgi:hypothetical protein
MEPDDIIREGKYFHSNHDLTPSAANSTTDVGGNEHDRICSSHQIYIQLTDVCIISEIDDTAHDRAINLLATTSELIEAFVCAHQIKGRVVVNANMRSTTN